MLSIKQKLFDLCLQYVTQRMETAQQAIQIAQASANEETKSSAGDKYETGRAMMQLEIEKNTVQLAEAQKLKQTLSQIDPRTETQKVQPGSLVVTNQGNFYIAISAGQLKIGEQVYFAIALASPIGQKLAGLKAGETTAFNNRSYMIMSLS